ncbi:outer membrane beta-barrel protein [Dyadobacter subterraneus]|uniref:PorT family protein n=1 Tax=Dyadobacter subterraneus TaxID=2773304 RepID=A0ABR9WDC4_9BACT|nr:outer membrane beta-barrel protein [Dyadobacter subterraneus]MBE9463482.1 PorT family protein [Dyadobacter subterraneus]
MKVKRILMRQVFIILLFLTGFLFFSPEVLAQGKFAFSASVSPFKTHSKSYVTNEIPNASGTGTTIVENNSENTFKGYSIGLNARYSFSPQWSASTGLWLSESNLNLIASSVRSHNLSIPVMVNYQAFDRKFSPYFSAGTLFNFRTTSHFDIPGFGNFIIKSDKYSRVSPTVGAGVIYNFAPHLSIIAQPTFHYEIPVSNTSDNYSRTYQLSFNVQLMYKL